MKRFLDQFTPQERRVGAVVGVMIIVALNFLFVWPHFNDLAKAKARMSAAQKTLNMFQAELRKKSTYEGKIKELQSEAVEVPLEDQAIHFDRFYHDRANEAGVLILGTGRPVIRTNEFFLEQEVGITFQSDEKQLVNYLYSLGAGGSMARVKAMSLRPDPSHQKLAGNLTIVASYQKKAVVKPGTPAATTKAVADAGKDDTVKPAAKIEKPVDKPVPKPVPVVPTQKLSDSGVRLAAVTNKTGIPGGNTNRFGPNGPRPGGGTNKPSLLSAKTAVSTNKPANKP